MALNFSLNSTKDSLARIAQMNRSGLLSRVLPLSAIGWLLATSSCLALYFFANPGHDLVVSVISYGFLSVALLLLIISLITTQLLRRSLAVQIFAEADRPTAQIPLPITLRVHGFKVPPLFSLSLDLRFFNSGPRSQTIVLSGASKAQQLLVVTTPTLFPHRGVWEIRTISVQLRDAIGVTRSAWEIPSGTTCEVHPQAMEIASLPIMAESARSGELSQYSIDRTGDLFDMKAYDPSDGIRRVLWKTFARSGQLFVRRPEPAIIPEGEIPIFIIAQPEEDEVASAALSYLQQLEREEIVALVGTDGLEETSSGARYVIGQEFARRALNRCALDVKAGSGIDLGAFIQSLLNNGKVLTRIVVFGGSSKPQWLAKAQQVAMARGLQVSLVSVPAKLRGLHIPVEQQNSLGNLRRIFPKRRSTTNLSANVELYRSADSTIQYLECESRN